MIKQVPNPLEDLQTTEKRRRKRDSNLRQRYGITSAQYEELLRRQDGMCATCSRESELVVDHCHVTKDVRGLLCGKCNSALGFVGENINILVAMVNYLMYGVQYKDKI